eukprot:m.19890 g.19890  ORF g.19890 m.19890 type:complete len:90 (-) comp7681_c0_seq1:24-293(-)
MAALEKTILDIIEETLRNPENSGILCIDNHGLLLAGRGNLRSDLAGYISQKALVERVSVLQDTDGSDILVSTANGVTVAVKKARVPETA